MNELDGKLGSLREDLIQIFQVKIRESEEKLRAASNRNQRIPDLLEDFLDLRFRVPGLAYSKSQRRVAFLTVIIADLSHLNRLWKLLSHCAGFSQNRILQRLFWIGS